MPEHTGSLRALIPVLAPAVSVILAVFGVAISFTKVQMESNINAAQLSSLENRIDRFQQAFDAFRIDINKDNRERDRLIERATTQNEMQNSRLDQILNSMRRMDDFYRGPPPPSKPQMFPGPNDDADTKRLQDAQLSQGLLNDRLHH